MSKEFHYLTIKEYKKLKELIKIWKKYDKKLIKCGQIAMANFSPLIDIGDEFTKQELNYFRDIGIVNFIDENDFEDKWTIIMEPTYLGVNYTRIAITNIFLELKWLIPLGISIYSYFN